MVQAAIRLGGKVVFKGFHCYGSQIGLFIALLILSQASQILRGKERSKLTLDISTF